MSKETEWAWEAKATRKELEAKHANKSPITRRRWRVEGTHAGNSRLLTELKAKDTRAKYGGAVHEVIPFTPIEVRQAKDLPACPYCEAAKGEPCQSSEGNTVAPHAKRWEVHHDG